MNENELLQRIEKLEFELERTRAYQECLNTIDKYTFYFTAGHMREIADLFAHRDDSFVEMAWGKYTGFEGVERCYMKFHTDGEPIRNMPGLLTIHTMITPVLEIAKNGKTARGTFYSPGVESVLLEDEDRTQCRWCWIKYGADFIKEDGQWKLWHFATFGTFMCDFYKSWGDESFQGPQPEKMAAELPEDWRPDAPITHDDWSYRKDEMPPLDLIPPQPYEKYLDWPYDICCETAKTIVKEDI